MTNPLPALNRASKIRDVEFRFPLAIDTPDYVITDSSGLTATSTP